MIKKRLIFIYRYFRQSRRWRRWINAQTLMIVAVSAVFLTTLAWTAPYSAGQESAERITVKQVLTATPSTIPAAAENQTPTEPTRTPYPPEYAYNSNQTIGVTLAGAVLVLIVVIGVLLYLPQKTEGEG